MKSNCCQAPIKNISGKEGTGYMVCTECNKPCDMENDNKLTAREILNETVKRFGLGIWEAHSDKMNRMIATEAMERYSNQQSTDLIKQVKELTYKRDSLQRNIGEHINNYNSCKEAYHELKAQNESLSQVIEGLTKALKDIKDWDDDLEDQWEDQGYRAIDALNKYNQTKQ